MVVSDHLNPTDSPTGSPGGSGTRFATAMVMMPIASAPAVMVEKPQPTYLFRRDARLSTCIGKAIQSIAFPASPRLDVASTTFAAQ